MCTYKNILIFLTIVVSTYSMDSYNDDSNDNSNDDSNDNYNEDSNDKNLSRPLTPEDIKKAYFEYYKEPRNNNNNYYEMLRSTSNLKNAVQTSINIPTVQTFISTPEETTTNTRSPDVYDIWKLLYAPQIEQINNQHTVPSPSVRLYSNDIIMKPNTDHEKSNFDFIEPNLRQLRSTQENGETNINSLDYAVHSNVRDESYRERVKHIREHLKKYMEHLMNPENINVATRHNFEPYHPEQNTIVLKIQDDNDELSIKDQHTGTISNDDALRFLHIIEGNELLKNMEDTDFRFHIAYSDS